MSTHIAFLRDLLDLIIQHYFSDGTDQDERGPSGTDGSGGVQE